MPEEPVSRRGFLAKTSAASAAALTTGASGVADAQEPKASGNDEDYVQSDVSLRAKSLVSVLTKKNLVDASALDEIIEYYETKVGPHNGAKVVAKSWVDREFRNLLLKDATAAIGELGFTGVQGADIVAVANTNGTSLSSCVTASLLLDEVAYLDTERCGYGELSRNARI